MSLQGSFETIALRDVMTLLASSNKSGELRVVGDHIEGRLWMQDGRLVGSKVGKSRGHVDALFELLRLTEGNFVFKDGVDAPAPEEPTTVEPVMREAEARLTEWHDIQLVVPSLEHRVQLIADLPTPDVTLSAQEWRLVMAVAMAATVRGVLEELDLGQFEGCRGIRRLVDAGLAVVEAPRVRPALPDGARLARRAAAAATTPMATAVTAAAAASALVLESALVSESESESESALESESDSEPDTALPSPRVVHRPAPPATFPVPSLLGLTAGLAPGLSSRLSSGLSTSLSWGDASDLSVEHPVAQELSAISPPSPFQMPGLDRGGNIGSNVDVTVDHDDESESESESESERGTDAESGTDDEDFEHHHLATVHHFPGHQDDDESASPLVASPELSRFSFSPRRHHGDDQSDALPSDPPVDNGVEPAPSPVSRDGGVDTINRGLLLKFLSSVRT